MDFTKKEYKEMLKIHNQIYMDLVEWLYKNHLKIWRQYEKEKLHGVKLQMLEKNESRLSQRKQKWSKSMK